MTKPLNEDITVTIGLTIANGQPVWNVPSVTVNAPYAQITWVLDGPPGFRFAQNGINFKIPAPGVVSYVNDTNFVMADHNRAKASFPYDINVLDVDGNTVLKTFTDDPEVLNDPTPGGGGGIPPEQARVKSPE